MRVRLGATLDGQVARLDTGRPTATLLLGDAGLGKTTLTRYVARWLARTEHRVTVATDEPYEWADLGSCSRLRLTTVVDEAWATLAVATEGARELVIIEGTLPAPGCRERVANRDCTLLITATGLWEAPTEAFDQTWGLLHIPTGTARGPVYPCDESWDPAQGRLDWGPCAVPLIPSRRGPQDFPPRRWHAPPHEQSTAAWPRAAVAG
jgi:hypothetical protein